jgi:DNA polymerase-3 subunit gamma/tau
MSSLALYRRYRPETFEEVIGQDHVTVPLQQALRNGRVNHAYLFSGPRGCGKTTSARILARALNCEQGPTPNPCGVCRSCQELARGGGGSIDVIEIDAASHGGVDDARDLRERAFFAPAAARYKIYIIDEAHMVTSAGFNALLKVVEEPPEHLKFIFATTEPDKVIGTIRSRTHHYPFRLVPPGTMRDYLAHVCQSEGIQVEQGVLPLVVRAGGGSVRDSMSVLDQLLAGAADAGVSYQMAIGLLGYTDTALLDDVVGALAAHDGAAVFELINRIVEGGHEPRRFVADLLERFRDLIVLRAVPGDSAAGLVDVPEDQAERMRQQAAAFGEAELSRAADIVNTGLTEMRGATAPRLQLELIGARLLLPAAEDTERGLAARLDALERRLARGMPIAAPTSDAPDAPTSGGAGRRPGGYGGHDGQGHGDQRHADQGHGTGPQAFRPTPDGAPTHEASNQHTSNQYTSTQYADERDCAPGDGGPRTPEARTRENGPSVRPAGASGGTPTLGTPPWKRFAGVPTPTEPREHAGEPRPDTPVAAAQARANAPMRESGPARETVAAHEARAGGPPRPPAPPRQERQAGAPVAPSGAVADPVAMRRAWPDVLDTIKSMRRYTWILLSQHAQVLGVDGHTLQLGFDAAGARNNFLNSSSDEVLRQALAAKLGAEWRVEAIVDPSQSPDTPQLARREEPSGDARSGRGGFAASAGGVGQAAPAEPPPWAAPASEPPAPGPSALGSSSTVTPSPPVLAPAPSEPERSEPERPVSAAPARHDRPAAEDSAYDDGDDDAAEPDDPGEFDISAEANVSAAFAAATPYGHSQAGTVGLDLLTKELGANVVEEYENPS